MKSKLLLELAMESQPAHILEIGEVQQAPQIGDYVHRAESGWTGYVQNRRWEIQTNGDIVVRCWLYKDPPRRIS